MTGFPTMSNKEMPSNAMQTLNHRDECAEGKVNSKPKHCAPASHKGVWPKAPRAQQPMRDGQLNAPTLQIGI